jgi:unconventional prefoldin RPB5 interactor 1
MIQRQGGFLKEEESEVVPLTEEEGGPKKISRFKAARLAKS